MKQQNQENLFAFMNRYAELYQKEEVKLPYHVNIIDELHANENAHSRILAKLLQQREILESFIEYLTEKKHGSFGNIKIESPKITQEKERIDLWIREKNKYAIIIENKVHYAGDQERQLERYIDKTIKEGFVKEQIYVVYLSPQHKEPNEQSWGKYKNKFQERYLNLSFNNDILYWLKEKALPNVKHKDVFLRSAIEQYIDHLEGMFSLRTINNKMNMELQKFIKKELELNGTPLENINKLLEKREQINSVSSQIDLLISETTKETDNVFFRESQAKLSAEFPNYRSIDKQENMAGLWVSTDNNEVRVNMSIDGTQLYCQIDTGDVPDKTLPESIRKKTEHLLPTFFKNDNTQIWKYFDRYDYDGVFKCFQEVMKILIQN